MKPLKVAIFLTLVFPAPAPAPAEPMDCSQSPEPLLCEKQQRSSRVIGNFVRHSPLDQEGSFQRIEAMHAAERANVARRAAAAVADPADSAPRRSGLPRNELADEAEIQRAQSAASSRFSTRAQRDGAADEAILRQSRELGVAPVLPDRTTLNVNVKVARP